MINRFLIIWILAGCLSSLAYGQPASQSRPATTQASGVMDLTEYGVRIEPDQRLIVMMAALDAAGFDPTPPTKQISPFRAIVRKDNAALDPALRDRMKVFFDKNRLPAPATAADQAARYLSLAYALGPVPT